MTMDEFVKANAATPDGYTATADALVQRMLATFEAHPEAADLSSAWDLFKVPGFKCDDLQPSAFQAGWAFAHAKRAWAARK